MDAGLRTPLLDLFRRGEVARDLRLMAAQGVLAPRPLEQLALLAHLAGDPDEEVRATADATLGRIPEAAIARFIAQSEVPLDLRDFFVRRGVQPAAGQDEAGTTPLVDGDETDYGEDGTTEEKSTAATRLMDMSVPQKVKAAMKGTREMRAILVRDPNRMVAAAVLSCPKLTEQEVEAFARMGNVPEDVLRTIGMTRAWTKNYSIALGLAKNPKTPLAISLTLLHRLNDRDVRGLSTDRNVPDPLRVAARKKVVASAH